MNILVNTVQNPLLVEKIGRLAFAFGIPPFVLVFIFFMNFPVLHPFLKKRYSLPLIIIPAGVIFPLALTELVQKSVILTQRGPAPIYGPLHPVYAAVLTAYTVFCLLTPLSSLRHVNDPLERAQLKMILIGFSSVGIGAATLQLILPFILGTRPLPGVAPSLTAILALFIAYSIIRYRFLDVKVVLRRLTIFGCEVLLLTLFFYPAIFLLSPRLATQEPLEKVMGSFLIALIGAFLLPLVNSASERIIDSYIFSGHYNYKRDLREFSKSMAVHYELEGLREFLVKGLERLLRTRTCQLFLWRNGEVIFAPDEGVKRSCNFFFEAFNEDSVILIEYELRSKLGQKEYYDYKKHFDVLNASVVVPLVTKGAVIGLLALGEKTSGEIFSGDDVSFLTTLGNQAAVAIHNAILYEEILSMKEYMEIVLEQMTCGILTVDTNMVVTRFNKKTEQLLSLPCRNLLGKPADVLPFTIWNALISTVKMSLPVSNQEFQVEAKDRNANVLSVSTAPLRNAQGQVIGALAVLTDLTEIKLLEAEVRRAERLATVGTLAAGMAHEIKNPLVSLKTFAQLLPIKYDDPEFRESFSHIAAGEIERINSLVEQLLRFARPPKPIPMPIDLHDPIEQTLALLSSEMAKKGIKITTKYYETPLWVFADAEQLKQVFMNVLLNALEATSSQEEPSLEISTGTRKRWGWPPAAPFAKLPQGYTQGDREAYVRIADNGPGIRESHIKHIFDPFFTTKDTGHGLGLSIAHGIVREHKGSINAENRPGGGAVFTIALPLLEAEAALPIGDSHELRADRLA